MDRAYRTLKPFELINVAIDHRLNALIPDPFKGWHHDEQGQEHRQADKNLIGWGLLNAKGCSKQAEDYDDTGKGRHHHQDGRCDAQDRDQADQLNHASR